MAMIDWILINSQIKYLFINNILLRVNESRSSSQFKNQYLSATH